VTGLACNGLVVSVEWLDKQTKRGENMTNIVIACQGGGSLSAFTAGVLKTLLLKIDREHYNIIGLSGTSGGAICALIAWYGLLIDDREEGARLLQQFWDDNSAADPVDAWENSWMVFGSWFAGIETLPHISPYWASEFGKEKLREMLEHSVPFNELPGLVKESSPLLHIGAVNVETGEFKVFTGPTITADKILASAAIPTMFRAVHIKDGEDEGIYWDGLFSQNPPIREFLPESPAETKPDEIWIIRIDPKVNRSEPKSIQEIDIRRNLLSGNLSLNQEIDFINKVNSWVRKGFLPSEQFKKICIRDDLSLDIALDESSKINRSPTHIKFLIKLGEEHAAQFLQKLANSDPATCQPICVSKRNCKI
jgi:NTE family protein